MRRRFLAIKKPQLHTLPQDTFKRAPANVKGISVKVANPS